MIAIKNSSYSGRFHKGLSMNLLAFDTSTEAMSIAVSRSGGAAQLRGGSTPAQGGAQASAHLIGQVMALLQQADLPLAGLGRHLLWCGPRFVHRPAHRLCGGPGAGLWRGRAGAGGGLFAGSGGRGALSQRLADQPTCRVTALLDARMDEMYAATWAWDGARWTELADSALAATRSLAGEWRCAGRQCVWCVRRAPGR